MFEILHVIVLGKRESEIESVNSKDVEFERLYVGKTVKIRVVSSYWCLAIWRAKLRAWQNNSVSVIV